MRCMTGSTILYDSQIRSSQWNTIIPIVALAAGANMAKPPTTWLMGSVNDCLVDFAGVTVASAVVPIGTGRRKRNKEKNLSETAPSN